MTALDWIGITSSLASLILSVLAIWLSLYFFKAGKASEREAAVTLAAMQSQVKAIESLTGRWMDRFTRHATREPSPDPIALRLLEKMELLSSPVSRQVAIEIEATNRPPDAEMVDLLIVLAYYTAIANFHACGFVPSAENYDEKNGFHTMVLRHVDQSIADFNLVIGRLNQVDPGALTKSRVSWMLEEIRQIWVGLIRTSAQKMAERAKEARSDANL